MRTRALLTASLLANAILLGGAAYLSKQEAEDLSSAPPLVVCVPDPQTIGAGALGTEPAPAIKVTKTAAYMRIESDDYKRYIAQLRSQGYAEDSVLKLITADVNDLFHWRARSQLYSANRVHP
jgi:hypothetical protein